MVAGFRNIFYFCNVKSQMRYDAAATKQRFLYPIYLVNPSRKERGSSNAHKVIAFENLTAPTAAFNIKV